MFLVHGYRHQTNVYMSNHIVSVFATCECVADANVLKYNASVSQLRYQPMCLTYVYIGRLTTVYKQASVEELVYQCRKVRLLFAMLYCLILFDFDDRFIVFGFTCGFVLHVVVSRLT
jgi:hypothetical protein